MAFNDAPEQVSPASSNAGIYQTRYPLDLSHLRRGAALTRPASGKPRVAPYRGIPVGCSYCVYESRSERGPCRDVPPATLVVGVGIAARLLCTRHARLGTWRT